jgi:hypothetical protein
MAFVMLRILQLVWLHTLQIEIAANRDWVAVGHLQAFLDQAHEHVAITNDPTSKTSDLIVH